MDHWITLMMAHSALIGNQNLPLLIKQVDVHGHPLVNGHGPRHLMRRNNIPLDHGHCLCDTVHIQPDWLQHTFMLSDTASNFCTSMPAAKWKWEAANESLHSALIARH